MSFYFQEKFGSSGKAVREEQGNYNLYFIINQSDGIPSKDLTRLQVIMYRKQVEESNDVTSIRHS